MARNDLIERTRKYAIQVILFSEELPNRPAGWVLGKQILRSGTSIGSNYREAQRSRTKSEFHSKIPICRQELDETLYWFELTDGAELVAPELYLPLMAETRELIAIFTAIAQISRAESLGNAVAF